MSEQSVAIQSDSSIPSASGDALTQHVEWLFRNAGDHDSARMLQRVILAYRRAQAAQEKVGEGDDDTSACCLASGDDKHSSDRLK